MKFTFSWLKDHLDTENALAEIAAKLSAIGHEVEGIENPAAKLAPFTIARVLEARPHPNADRLRVCRVDTGKGQVEVVCGAPNARAGLIGVFAPVGSYIPGTKITLEKRAVRGVVSNGMLLSERELELSDEHEGIIELDSEHAADIGKRYIDVMGLDDPVIEVKLTPNRPDCTGVRGLARDLAAAGLGKLKPEPKLGRVEGTFDCPIDIRLEFSPNTADACPMFAGRYVQGVTNAPSPVWMQRRLTAVGLRPISTLVDITNYISLDRGRPLHVYDADKLEGAVRARLGTPGERFLALDGKEYEVDAEMCVIADDSGPLGLGGIIGGESTGCTAHTKNVLIECAYFDPRRTAATGRKLGVNTDARYRFERGVDPAFVAPGLDLATDMILKLAGGSPSKAKIAGAPPLRRTVISFDLDRIEKLGGLRIDPAEARTVLVALGFALGGKDSRLAVTVPTWRPDVHGPADLVEEVLRIVGLDRVPSAAMPRAHGVTGAVLTDLQRRARRARRVLAGRGLTEVVTWSFISAREARLFGGGADALEVANPISVEMSSMRPGLLPGLLLAGQRNRNRGFDDIAIFELGQAYRGIAPDEQMLLASGVRMGAAQLAGHGRHWRGSARPADVFDAKADAMALLAALGIDLAKVEITRDAPAWFHPGHSGTVRLGPKLALAHFGEFHPEVLKALDVGLPVAGFEVYLDALPVRKRKALARTPLAAAHLLPVRRDFAFVLDEAVPAADVIRAAGAADRTLIADVSVFDVFSGEALGPGKKSLAIEVTLQPKDRTLTDAEIEAISQRIIARVAQATGGRIRT
ncbi:MAG TPA: phenylalanine--tRNA ligase subunit beta [Hyphomicrobiaceae bacterium]|nr:phenylalanine--tRNA ligase subunit beta [Hyphomicrobiaceae bacterium]